MLKVCVDGTPIRGKLTGIGVYTLNLINALYQLQETENFTLDIYFHPSVKNWLLRKLSTPELLSHYPQVSSFPIPVSLANLLAKYSPVVLPYFDRYLEQPNIIHGTDHYVYPYRKGVKVMTIHDLTFIKHPKYSTTIVKGYLERIKRCLKWTNLIITFSENTKKDIVQLLNVNPDIIYITPQASRYSANYLTRKLIYDHRDVIDYYLYKPYFLFVSTLEPRKNILTLIEAFEYLKKNYKIPHQLILVGKKGWNYQGILDKIEASNFKEDIQHLDYLSDELVALFYNQAEAFIYPSYYEGFGLPVLEAMTLGAPVIASDTSSLPEVGGDAALYFNPYDYHELAQIMLKIIDDSTLRKEMINKGKKQAQKFSWERTAQATLKAYQSTDQDF
ncbi:glycosyltransferase family 1 protein [Crocosphaera sp. XPORK-15E]|uniref:glycosyltransferase family 4 protein n=1 Tax=Crocosphaera sp. XPORK-15E TaxID=3110247 RepID=UPI002B21B07F|nr:glycosyltransferase family 1 protein [Crocosphaera sp. XPORK-15E]MEA5535461.1 glycosyltransferase family 1 protein [Crocosphaera sp. XPORK-15E]